MVISFDIDWYFLDNKTSLKPQILLVVLSDGKDDHFYQSDMRYINDIRVLNENMKKEELTFYKTFPRRQKEIEHNTTTATNNNNPVVVRNTGEYTNVHVQVAVNKNQEDKREHDLSINDDNIVSNEEIIAMYDLWMSDHHYSFYGYYKYIRRILGFIFFIISFIVVSLFEQYHRFSDEQKQYNKKK